MRDSLLSSSTKVSNYLQMKKKRDTHGISGFVYERFYERYIQPFENSSVKHGFGMMAISCLMIESLISFQKGWKKTGKPGKEVFENFFSDSNHLSAFNGFGKEFYENIRCGLLHQAETTGGWHIRRDGDLFDKKTKTINATKFMKALHRELKDFITHLKHEHFESKSWENLIKKIDSICKNI